MIAKEEYTLAQAIQSRLTLHEMRMYYRLSSDDIVRVFFLAHAGPPQRLQETATECPHDSGHSVAPGRDLFQAPFTEGGVVTSPHFALFRRGGA